MFDAHFFTCKYFLIVARASSYFRLANNLQCDYRQKALNAHEVQLCKEARIYTEKKLIKNQVKSFSIDRKC